MPESGAVRPAPDAKSSVNDIKTQELHREDLYRQSNNPMATMEPGTSSHFVIEYDANKNPVHSVTVFQTDRAEVSRF